MPPARTRTATIPDSELPRLLDLLGETDSVELKLTVPEAGQRAAIAALGLDPLDAQIRQVFFFDTPDLALNKAGVVVRARRVQRKGDDSVVKLRPVVPSELPLSIRSTDGFTTEVDAMPGGFVCSGTMKREMNPGRVREALNGDRPIRKLFSKEQRAFYAEHAPAGIGLEDLSVLGPIFVLKLKFVPEGFDQRLVAEMWLYPDDSRIVELSTKCTPAQTFMVAAETRAYLAQKGVDTGGEQETKTRKALQFFSRRMKAEAAKEADEAEAREAEAAVAG
jgi:hypothetical protein